MNPTPQDLETLNHCTTALERLFKAGKEKGLQDYLQLVLAPYFSLIPDEGPLEARLQVGEQLMDLLQHTAIETATAATEVPDGPLRHN